MNQVIIYILISVLAGAVGQVLLKTGMTNMGPQGLSLPWNHLGGTLWSIVTNPFVFVGLLIYAGATILWLVALSRVDLSFAYPFVSLGYVIMVITSWLLLKENITPLRLLGTLVVCLGVLIISRS